MSRLTRNLAGRGALGALRSQSGQVMVLFVVALPMLAAMVALVVNLGGWFSSDAGVQKAADFGALAGAQYLAAQSAGSPGTPGPCSGSPGYSACAKTVAQQSFDGESLTFCDLNGGAANPWQPAANEVEVGVCHNAFQGIYKKANIRRYAIAKYGGVSSGTGALPFTFRSQDWPGVGGNVTFKFQSGGCSGCFDMLNFGGSGPCGSNGASQIAQCIQCAQTYSLPNLTPNPPLAGCPAATTICTGATFGSNPGFKVNSTPIGNAIQSLYGKVVLIPIYSSASGSGSGATYTIGGFAAIQITNWNKKTSLLSGTFWGFLLPNTGACTGTGGNFGVYSIGLVG